MVDIYNPYSLVHALKSKELENYWAVSGSTTLLPKFVDNMKLCLKDLEEDAYEKEACQSLARSLFRFYFILYVDIDFLRVDTPRKHRVQCSSNARLYLVRG